MFTKRIIPCLDVNNGRVVKGVNFVNLQDAGDPAEIRWLILSEEWPRKFLFHLLWAAASGQLMISVLF